MSEESQSSSDFKKSNKDLYGLLLSTNQKIDDVGMIPFCLGILWAVLLCLTIHMRWVDSFMGIRVETVRSIWVYLAIALFAFIVSFAIALVRQKSVYEEHRPEIVARLERDHMSVDTLLAEIADDRALSLVREKLAGDTDIELSRAGKLL
jgi:hypothetical protein